MKRTPLARKIAHALSFAEVRQAIGLAPTDTLAFFRAKGYATQAHWDELWQQEHGRAFTVTKMLDGELLAKVRASLDDVIAKGGTFEQWKASILPALRSHGWFGKVEDPERTGVDHPIFVGDSRLRTIFDTNLRTAQAAGRWAGIQKAKAYRPYLMWNAVHDTRTRPLHRLWGGLDDGRPIILPVDHPCWSIYFPPCGWGCRCSVIQLSERDLQRRGLAVTTDAELVAKGWMTADGQPGGNRRAYKRTDGSIEKVPAGIDPGFAYNPGEDFLRALAPGADVDTSAGPIIRVPDDAPPMPEPRLVPESELIPADTPTEEAVRRFIANFPDAPNDGSTVATVDRMGQPVVIGESFFYRGGSSATGPSKLALDPGRIPYVNLFAATINDPDEIWWRWEPWTDATGKQGMRLVRRYIARFQIGGKERSLLLSLTYGQGGWNGLTAFMTNRKGYISGDKVRGGVLGYRRA